MTRIPMVCAMAAAMGWLGAAGPVASAQCGGSQDQKLRPWDGASGDEFGRSVDISGDVAVVGAPYEFAGGSYSGSAYVFRHDGVGWRQDTKLLPAGRSFRDLVGWSVAVDGPVIAVGAIDDDTAGNSAGAVILFRHDGTAWQEEQKLTASDAAAGDAFGYSVAVSGDVMVASSLYHDDRGRLSGAAYVFRHAGGQWTEEAELLPSDGQAADYFGKSVAVDGDVIVIGSYQHDAGGTDAGAAYVYRNTGGAWVEEQKLVPADAAATDYHGLAVGVSGDVIVASSSLDDDNGLNSGSVYVYRHVGGTWTEEQKLLASDGAIGDRFGESTAVDGGNVVVGAWYHDGVAQDSGAAYSYHYDGVQWNEGPELLADDGSSLDYLGTAIAISGGRALVGAPMDDDQGAYTGSAYAFLVDGLLLDANQATYLPADLLSLLTCGGLPGSPRLLAAIDVNGTPTFLRVDLGPLDAVGERDFGGAVPPGLGGLVVQFLALGFTPDLRLAASNVQAVSFL